MERSQGPFQVRAQGWVGGPVTGWGHVRGNHLLMFLSLSFFFPSPLSKNKCYKNNDCFPFPIITKITK